MRLHLSYFVILFTVFLLFDDHALGHGSEFEEKFHDRLATYVRVVAQLEIPLAETGATQVVGPGVWQQVAASSGAWQVMEAGARLWFSAVQTQCGPQPISEDMFLQDLLPVEERPHLVASAVRHLVDATRDGARDITTAGADIGSRLGRTFLVAKVFLEVVETVASVGMGLKGAHLVCNAMDVALIFSARHIQTNARAREFATVYGRSKFLSFWRRWVISARVRKVFDSVELVAGPLGVDRDLLEMVDADGPRRGFGYLKAGKRARFVEWVDKKVQAHPENNFRFRLRRKDFLAPWYSRQKKTFLVLSRKSSGYYLRSQADPLGQILEGSEAWALSLQEGILNRVSRLAGSERVSASQPTLFDEVVEAQLQERMRVSSARAHWERALVGDVVRMFDPTIPRTHRYVLVRTMEAMFAEYLYPLLKFHWDEEDEGRGLRDLFGRRYRRGKFMYFVSEWMDFLRVTATNPDPLTHEEYMYGSVDFLGSVLDHIELLTAGDAVSESDLDLSLLRIGASRPWLSRRAPHRWGWIPVLGRLRCEQL